MIRVVLPYHLRILARAGDEVCLEVQGQVTLRAVMDALEASYPMLRGTIRDHVTLRRRPFIRFFACKEDFVARISGDQTAWPGVTGAEPVVDCWAMAGG